MKRTIEINTQHIESIEVVEMSEHHWYEYLPPTKGNWFFPAYTSLFIIEFSKKLTIEEVEKINWSYIDGEKLYVQQHIKIKMSSGKIHKLYYKSMEELKTDVDVFKSGVDEFLWKKILI